MEELRLHGVVTRLNYSSEDVDKERELEAPPGYRSQPLGGTEEQGIYDCLIEKVYSWLQAVETASEGKSITFMDSNAEENPLKGRHGKAPIRKVKKDGTVGKTFTKPPKIISKARDTSKYCEFHQDYGQDTNACRKLKSQIEEDVKSGK
ncbi:hypothetical protein Tco_0132232 [Tanacetum coccineum]